MWERNPSQDTAHWNNAYHGCLTKKVGGRYGWRLPSFAEICSLWEDDTEDHLPEGHPFQNIRSHYYWSSTTSPANTDAAMVLRFGDSSFLPMTLFEKTSDSMYMWCVRGGQGYDGL